eukprot:Phypoly_transcript_00042.p1 GENE.Phypoly_transcript_00042~~Phypoly_transcript_00042.p1  ORF type:complete len:1769 (+),score=236.41 Phypoly_transcript_00042:758-5308(+)
MAFGKHHMLSPDGRCKSFDARGDGYVRSEGFCVLVIKPLSKAVVDRDPIRAIIRATGTNQDGKTAGLTFPDRAAQESLLRSVYAKGKVKLEDVQYIETHGTGTKVGDPVEVNAIGTVLGAVRDKESTPLHIGSVKSNIGHVEGASGLTGIIKTVVAMEKGLIPGNLHFSTPNPSIDFIGMRLCVVSTTIPWPNCEKKIAGINSFGFGGSNAHAIIEEFRVPAKTSKSPVLNQYHPFIFSAHTKQATEQLIAEYHQKVKNEMEEIDDEKLRNISYTLACRRSRFSFRVSVVASSKQDLVNQLKTLQVSKLDTELACKILFVFVGQGAQYFAMGRELLRENSVFLQTMKLCEMLIRKHMQWSLLDELAKPESESKLGRPEIAQPACTALQISLVKVWEAYGVKPSVVVGHSSGEIAAAFCSGVLSLEEAMLSSIARATALRDTPTTPGKMAAVSISDGEAKVLIESYAGKINIAAVNSPGNVTLSGDATEIDEIVGLMKTKGVFAQVLRTERAYHSHQMTQVGLALKDLLMDVKCTSNSYIPMVSTVTGELLEPSEVNGNYWSCNLTGTVKFAAALQRAAQLHKFHAVVEIGPHPALAGPIRQSLAAVLSSAPPVLPTICRKEPETRRIMATACALGDVGFPVNWEHLFTEECKVVPNLPTYPWQGKSYWHESVASKMRRFPEKSHELLGARTHHMHGAWANTLRLDVVDYLVDHCVQGSIVFPGAGFLAMMIAASGAPQSIFLEEINFASALVFSDKDKPVNTQVVLNSSLAKSPTSVSILSESDKHEWQEHCAGKFTLQPAPRTMPVFPKFNSWTSKCPKFTSSEEVYKIFRQMGLEYGHSFQGITELWKGNSEAYAFISSPDSTLNTRAAEHYLIHPTILDASFQTLLGCLLHLSETYLPTKIAKIQVLHPCRFPKYVVHAICTQITTQTITGNISIFTPEGMELCAVQGLECTSIGGGKKTASYQPSWHNLAYETVWKEDASLCVWKDIVPNVEQKVDPLPNTLALDAIRKACDSIKSKNTTIAPQHAKLFSWMLECLKSALLTENPHFDGNSSNPETILTSRFRGELENILLGKTNPLSLMFGDELIYEVYENGPSLSGSSKAVRQVLPYFSHKNCTAAILEIGAGTGGTKKNEPKKQNKKNKKYTFTDISASFFEKAKSKFSNSLHKMIFQPLDIEKDIVGQGFQPNYYDIVIATDVLHATSNVVDTLKNVHKLLKPGGVLILNELVNCPIWNQMVFGTLDGWWKFEDVERRTIGPTLSETGWIGALEEAGFCENQVISDSIHGTFIAKTRLPKSPQHTWYIVPDDSGVACALANLQLPELVIAKSVKEIPARAHVLYLASLSPQIFDGLSANVLSDMQQITSQSAHVIWVTAGAAMDVRSPTLAPIIGLSRTLRNECPQLLSHTLDLDPSDSPAQSAKTIFTFVSSLLATFAFENEIVVRKTRYYIPRLIPARISTGAPTSVKPWGETCVKLQIGTPGLLNSLQWVSNESTELDDDHVEIYVFAAGKIYVH